MNFHFILISLAFHQSSRIIIKKAVSLPYWCWVLKDNANTTQHSMIIASMEVCFHHIKIVPNDMSFYALNRNFLTLTKVVLTLSFAINRIE